MTEAAGKRVISCGTHGEVLPAFVCCHLVQESDRPLGFVEPDVDPNDVDDDLQAWCGACDLMLQREGEWNDVSEGYANIRLVCEFCFAKLRETHHRPVSALYDQ
jgi:hypothetical protein